MLGNCIGCGQPLGYSFVPFSGGFAHPECKETTELIIAVETLGDNLARAAEAIAALSDEARRIYPKSCLL